ncbi:MAG: DNA polymerase I [Acidimicrobiaceae bacterium]|nr:DNA polymerase I [Acidimicrobiaceae bacterium]
MPLTLLVDAYSLAFRAYFAIPAGMATQGGTPTNAVFGFLRMFASLVEQYSPDRVLVAFDAHAKTFRDEIYAEYKGHRPQTPAALSSQLPILRDLMDAIGVAWLEVPGYEADDVIATAAQIAADAGDTVRIVTGDRDSFQLVKDPKIAVLYNRRGVSEIDTMDEAAVVAKVGVVPWLYPHLASLRGDPSDNIIGVTGVGEKTAAKLVNEYGSIQEILDHLDSLSPKLAASIGEARDRVVGNLTLSMLVKDVPLEAELESFTLGPWNSNRAREFMYSLELRNSFDRLRSAFKDRVDLSIGSTPDLASRLRPEVVVVPFQAGQFESAPVLLIKGFLEDGSDATGLNSLVVGARLSPEVICVEVVDGDLLAPMSLESILKGKQIRGIATKEILKALLDIGLRTPPTPISDLSIAEYLLDPSSGRYSASDISATWFGDNPVGEVGTGLFDTTTSAERLESAVLEIALIDSTTQEIESKLDSAGMGNLYREVELPLVSVLAKMEHVGIAVDVVRLRELTDWIASQTRTLYAEMQSMIGRSFNPNSTQQLAQILFTELGLKPIKKTKTGFSTDAQTLERLSGEHPFVETLLRYREFEKLRSTYGETLISEVKPDGRIHATFQQTVARTGRLSSERPNMHNIPIRSEEGRRFREVFVAPPGHKLIVADYSQIELRIIAHLSGDPGLVEAFKEGRDIHTQTAAMVFGVELEQVTHEQRATAKMVAYGLAYGMEAFGLAQRLGISNKEAEQILNSFFSALPNVRAYMDRTVAEAKRLGYTATEFGRRRYIPELQSPDQRVRQAAERQAMNAGIQGLAADIFKISLVRLDSVLRETDLTRLVLQVHDEVILEAPESDVESGVDLVIAAMEGAAELTVPLKVNIAVGATWGSAKG